MRHLFRHFASLRFSPLLLLCALVWGAPQFAAAADKAKAAQESDLFDSTNIVQISIAIPENGMRALRGTGWGGNNGGNRPEAKATVSDGIRTYKDVAIHLKGAAGSFRPVDDRPGLTLNFDKHVKGQTFHGLEKFSLNNSVQDPSYLAEKIGRETYRKAGVPVPRTDYAVVTLNGRNLGLYVLAEGYNKQFLAQHFKNPKGNLYDGGFCQDITGNLSLNDADNPKVDQSDLRKLIAVTSEARQNNKFEDLAAVLDVERFVTMTALDVLLCHWDGYALNRNNYRIYGDPDSKKMVFMPHGMDQLFGQGRGMPDTAINPHMNGMVARAVLGTKEGRMMYRTKLGQLRTNVFNPEQLKQRARELEMRIQQALPANRKSRHKSAVNQFCQMIDFRAEDLERQFSTPPAELQFNSQGFANITDWKPRNAVSSSRYSPVEAPDGRKYLHIGGDGASSSASWRTRVMLPTGQYKLEGLVRTKGVGETGAGVVLRISGARDVQPVSADDKWRKITYDFAVEEAVADVEVVAELRPAFGEVWFDVSSMKIVQLSNK
ncbi:MAG TPA: CotH kinase family protein [Verrucomicrobiae bacterium]